MIMLAYVQLLLKIRTNNYATVHLKERILLLRLRVACVHGYPTKIFRMIYEYSKGTEGKDEEFGW